MFNSKYVSVKQIADKIKRGRFYKDTPFESIVDYAVEAISLILSEDYLVTKPLFVEIKDHKAGLPCGFEYMVSCSKFDNNCYTPMNTGTDMHHDVYSTSGSGSINGGYTYSLNNGNIFTNFKEGKLFLVFKEIPTDEDGYPKIPDNINVKLAVEFYIKYNYLNDMGSDENVIINRANKDETEYCWYVGKAQAAATNMTLDEMESFANSLSNLFDDPNQFKNRLQYLHAQNHLKIK